MAFSTVLEKLGRAIFEAPFESRRLAKEAPELAEIRLLALDEVKAKTQRIDGKLVFPFNLVRICLRGVPGEQEPVFKSEFLARYFAEEFKTVLTRGDYRFSRDLKVLFETTSKLPEGGESWVAVEVAMQPAPAPPPVENATGKLSVLHGKANQQELLLSKPRINIGRGAEVYRPAGPSRRNDFIFLGEDEAGKSVSREHAHVVRTAGSNEYRLFNDRDYKGEENCGLWIVRDGLSFPVHRSARGTLLEAGDEIYLGKAVVVFSMAAAAPKSELERTD